jgi:N-acetylmuramoyl-L-alanine amidase
MKTIKYLIVHHHDTEDDIGLREIDRLHRAEGGLGCGYHFVIRRNGHVEPGRLTTQAGIHCEGHDHHSLGVCLIGRTPTAEQTTTLIDLYHIIKRDWPKIRMVNHEEITKQHD